MTTTRTRIPFPGSHLQRLRGSSVECASCGKAPEVVIVTVRESESGRLTTQVGYCKACADKELLERQEQETEG